MINRIGINNGFYGKKHTPETRDKRGGYLEADHIKAFAFYPELRLELSNGRTLCLDCHKGTPNYAGRAFQC